MSWGRKVLVIAGVAGAMALIVSAVDWVGTRTLEKRFDETVEELRARGEPMTLAELAPAEIPKEENAAVLYEEAFVLLEKLPEESRQRIETLRLKKEVLNAEELAEGHRLLQEAKDVLEVIRAGSKLTRSQYAIDYSRDAYMVHSSSEVWGLGELAGLSARVNADEGKVEEAIADCEIIGALARSISSMATGNALRRALRMELLKYRGLTRVVEQCEVNGDQMARMQGILGEPHDRQWLVRDMKIQRVVGLAYLRDVRTDPNYRKKWGSEASWRGRLRVFLGVGEPSDYPRGSWLRDAPGALKLMERCIELAGKPWYESGPGWEEVYGEAMGGSEGRLRPAAMTMVETPYMMARLFERTQAEAGNTKLGLALRLYKMKTGSYPERLEELAPEYVKELPVDPFSGKSFLYRREGDGFIVYSVGVNLVDDGGGPMGKVDDVAWKCER